MLFSTKYGYEVAILDTVFVHRALGNLSKISIPNWGTDCSPCLMDYVPLVHSALKDKVCLVVVVVIVVVVIIIVVVVVVVVVVATCYFVCNCVRVSDTVAHHWMCIACCIPTVDR